MIRPLGLVPNPWLYTSTIKRTRPPIDDGALDRQLGALDRRQQLEQQQQQLQAGAIGLYALPPYPARPRPPS
jgi:hypothetical protein